MVRIQIGCFSLVCDVIYKFCFNFFLVVIIFKSFQLYLFCTNKKLLHKCQLYIFKSIVRQRIFLPIKQKHYFSYYIILWHCVVVHVTGKQILYT